MTTNGPLAPRYFIRLSKTGDPNAAISYNVGNGGPTLDQRSVIDAGFLELVRLGELPANDPDVVRVAAGRRRDDRVDDAERPGLAPLQRRRLRRRCDRRASVGAERPGDGPPLAGALGRARRAGPRRGRRGRRGLAARRAWSDFASGVGLIPEQDWELPDLAAVAVRHRSDARLDRLHRTAARPARRRRSPGRPPPSCGSRPTSRPDATSHCPA